MLGKALALLQSPPPLLHTGHTETLTTLASFPPASHVPSSPTGPRTGAWGWARRVVAVVLLVNTRHLVKPFGQGAYTLGAFPEALGSASQKRVDSSHETRRELPFPHLVLSVHFLFKRIYFY